MTAGHSACSQITLISLGITVIRPPVQPVYVMLESVSDVYRVTRAILTFFFAFCMREIKSLTSLLSSMKVFVIAV